MKTECLQTNKKQQCWERKMLEEQGDRGSKEKSLGLIKSLIDG